MTKFISSFLVICTMFTISATGTYAIEAQLLDDNLQPVSAEVRVESDKTPEVERTPIPVPDDKQLMTDEEEKKVRDSDAPAAKPRSTSTTPQTQTQGGVQTQIHTEQSGPNLIPNGDFESAGSNGLPTGWFKGGWGNNTRVLTYPVTGFGGGKAVQTVLSNRVSGDAKWWFAPVAVTGGKTYTYSGDYKSNVSSYITAQYQHSNGSLTWVDLAQPAASSDWKFTVVDFTVPSTVVKATIFHLINKNGSLSIDNVSLTEKGGTTTPPPPPPVGDSVFETGAVTIRLDDNWISQYQYALPALNNVGLDATWYVTSRQIFENGFPGYMSRAQIEEVYDNGYEIGAHTRTHRDLVTLSQADQVWEIQGSREDLLAWDVGPVRSFSIPFGSYNAQVLQNIKNAGFESSASSNGGDVTPSSDPYQLERRSVENQVSFSQVKAWIDSAVADKEWLILTFHEVRPGCTDRYCTTTAVFNQILNYLKSQNIRVITVSDAIDSI